MMAPSERVGGGEVRNITRLVKLCLLPAPDAALLVVRHMRRDWRLPEGRATLSVGRGGRPTEVTSDRTLRLRNSSNSKAAAFTCCAAGRASRLLPARGGRGGQLARVPPAAAGGFDVIAPDHPVSGNRDDFAEVEAMDDSSTNYLDVMGPARPGATARGRGIVRRLARGRAGGGRPATASAPCPAAPGRAAAA